jgi:hypothetical protein
MVCYSNVEAMPCGKRLLSIQWQRLHEDIFSYYKIRVHFSQFYFDIVVKHNIETIELDIKISILHKDWNENIYTIRPSQF